MNRPLVRIIGFGLVGLALTGLAARLTLAAASGDPFYGRNVYGQPVGTYLALAIFAVAGLFGIVWVVQRLRKATRR